MTFTAKLKRDGAPIAFFALVVCTKIYSLWSYLSGDERLWFFLRHIDTLDVYGPGALYYLTNQLSYLLYFITAIAFDALVFYSFIVRNEAKSRPEGLLENLFPLITVFVPVIGFTLLFFPSMHALLPGYSPETLAWLSAITPFYGFYLSLVGFVLGFIGAGASIWALSYLKRSFGLRAAVRTLVTEGPYKRIRHPLYVGEIIHILGVAILSGTPVGLWLFAVSVVLQVIRAKIEERKFLRTLPEYATYRASTGFLWPKLGRSTS
ncbi:methyltransferase family protein [Thiocystis violacea]|uniref:methyltransferase family protein n=1 Tax=Thiocystis violacea TaxID=13725 RepID=UPI0019074884|nr:isoprenylcysteine carboxylmethyltransferase family protein [Thiocystis violacea]MBK1722525.1 hypothetical protein [Thiocystis violacea]